MSDLKNLVDAASDVTDVLEMAVSDPLGAADVLDDWASQLHILAEQLRREVADDGISSPSGFGDKVMTKVFGPDGELKASGGTSN